MNIDNEIDKLPKKIGKLQLNSKDTSALVLGLITAMDALSDNTFALIVVQNAFNVVAKNIKNDNNTIGG